jgi:hypothetical protein
MYRILKNFFDSYGKSFTKYFKPTDEKCIYMTQKLHHMGGGLNRKIPSPVISYRKCTAISTTFIQFILKMLVMLALLASVMNNVQFCYIKCNTYSLHDKILIIGCTFLVCPNNEHGIT